MIRCPNCGYEGKGKKLGTSCLDLLIAIFLLCLGILPGIIFLVWQQGKAHKVVCPACGFKNVVRLPKSQQARPPQSLLSRLQSPQAQPLESQPLQSSPSQLPSLPKAEKSGLFTKQQMAILAALGFGVLCVLCFGGYIVVSEESAYRARPVATSPSKATDTPRPTVMPVEKEIIVPAGKLSELSEYPTDKDVFVRKRDGTIDPRPNDLEELCKDWLYYRKKILEYVAAGKTEKAAKAREQFQKINAWLNEYDETDVNTMFSILEEQGYSPP